MDQLPTEIILHVISFLYDTKDKIELLRVNRSIHSLITHNQSCWSPLDLSLYRDRINNGALISILRSHSLDIIVPRQQQKHQRELLQLQLQPQPRMGAQLDHIDISGCHLLTSEALLMLVHTLPYLKVLHLNKYPATSIPEPLARHPRYYRRTRSTMIDMLRDDLYQCRPRHGLSSSTMDLSKQPLASLSISDTTLLRFLPCTPFLTDLSLQHQPISYEACRIMKKELGRLRHLDISSCQITVNSLQYLIRSMAITLQSLKMLNLELSDMTLLCLQLFGERSLECLHLSCLDPNSLPGLTRALRNLTRLTDFRLTRLPSGNIDRLITTLSTCQLTSLDLSPKLELYPSFTTRSAENAMILPRSSRSTTSSHLMPPTTTTTTTSLTTSSKSRTTQSKPTATFSRSERHLYLTTLDPLITSYSLTELRLCFPTLNATTLTRFFNTTQSPLRVLELRLRDTTTTKGNDDDDDEDYLEGLDHLTSLHTLLLYSVPLTTRSVDTILRTRGLKSMTIHDATLLCKSYPLFLKRWLTELPRLGLVRMDRVPFAWTSISDLLRYPHVSHIPDHPLYHGDSMLVRTALGRWEWVD